MGLTELILDRSHDAVISLDERGVVTYWNPSAERIFGIPRDQALGRLVAELIIPFRFHSQHEAGIRRFLAEGVGPMLDRRVQLAALRADGTEFPIDMTITALEDDGVWTFTAFVRDVSDLVRSEREREELVAQLRRALRESEVRFEAIVGSLSDPVTIRNREHELIYANPAALSQLGFASVQELRDAGPDQIMAHYRVFSADGQEITMGELPSVRLLSGQAAEPLLIRSVHRRTASDRWSLLKSSPVLDDDGVVQATITMIEDVTDQQRAERHNEFLARASEVLASSLDYERTLRNVAELAVPEVVDWCAVDILDEDGKRQSVAVAHTDPDRVRLARELREYEPAELDPEQGLGRVFRTGQPLLYPEIPDELLARSARDERHLELLRSVGMRSAVVVPMRLGTRTLGAMSLVSAESGRVLDRADLDLAEQIAARAAVAIENARLYTQRSRIAHTLQASLLPQKLPEIPGYELASAYIPAVAGTEVGGDFYDVWPVGSDWMITVGDVTGKGVQAAALTSLVRHTLRAASGFLATPAALLAHLDHTLKTQSATSLCTALCLRLDADAGRLTMATGGHPPPLYVSASAEEVRMVRRYGPLLGGLSDVHWEDVTLELDPGAQLLLYTDGITDAVGEGGERYGLNRLTDQLRAGRPRSVSEMVEAITRSLAEFQTGTHADDMALLALGRLSGGATPAERSQAGVNRPATVTR